MKYLSLENVKLITHNTCQDFHLHFSPTTCFEMAVWEKHPSWWNLIVRRDFNKNSATADTHKKKHHVNLANSSLDADD